MKELFDIRLHEAAEKEYNQLDGSVLDEVNKVMNELIFRYGKDKMIRMVKIIIEADYSPCSPAHRSGSQARVTLKKDASGFPETSLIIFNP
ncbi:hypothetical protein [Paenibacillus sp. 23TSA30-6]|uniref:hypothetical protein n=1 Tax=Paenibacillus sp. 23TSA30-6 TaxID=2546104 RepID=UPI001787C2AA|nr:hypothetical protein [Paenibacillus sp. 23TSA30-6]MBE0336119.1 hypothetical protein [Paenibacillus sp. 23TSA30-6]